MPKLKKTDIPQVRAALQAAQGQRCPLCKASFTDAKLVKGKLVPKFKPALDHCHTHGYIRGVLCNNCNGLEGKIKNRVNRAKRDNTLITWLENLLAYWKQHETPQNNLIHPDHKTDDEKRLLKNKRARIKRARAKAAKLLKK